MCAYGVVHLTIAWIAVRVAWMGYRGSDTQTGALTDLASTGFGEFSLWFAAVGLFALVVWQVFEAIWRRQTGERPWRAWAGRAGSIISAGSYLYLGVSAVGVALDGRALRYGRVREHRDLLTPAMVAALVTVIGVVLLVIAGRAVWRGWTRGFLEDLRPGVGRWVVVLGVAGYIGKGLAFGLIGFLMIVTVVQGHRPHHPGLDAVLRLIDLSPASEALLALKAAAIGAFGVYCFVWAVERRR
nr:DUF1206 domain-containing protein [Nakamurella flavida]